MLSVIKNTFHICKLILRYQNRENKKKKMKIERKIKEKKIQLLHIHIKFEFMNINCFHVLMFQMIDDDSLYMQYILIYSYVLINNVTYIYFCILDFSQIFFFL